MTHEEMSQKLRNRYYDDQKHDEFYEDLMKVNNLDSDDRMVQRMYSLAWENGHSAGYHEVFLHFNDLVHVFKG